MSTSPVVKRMVMFKHGVAYLERGGPADGPFELSFKRSEMNDVLKSLAVWVARGDATVSTIAFEKPEDPEQALAERKLLLPEGAALQGMLASLRGRRVAAIGHDRVEGEVIGVESVSDAEGRSRRTLLLRTESGRISLLDLAVLRSIELLEGPSRADLEFLVDRSRAATAGESRSVHIVIAGQAEDLRLSYVIPAPVWRVSYRFARDGESTVIMAWGIVHNPADEDLPDIELTLTTGQPVSFQIDLYHPKTVHRAVVEEKTRAVAQPTSFERAPVPQPAAPPASRMRQKAGRGADFGGGPEVLEDATINLTQALSEAGSAATYADRGELFEYRLASRVSLKRGGSAMVSLFSAKLDARKERIWRAGEGPSPDLVLTFKNETGAVLEEGPAVVYDDNVYAGEAMVPYSARGVEVKLGFAKDLGVRCKHEVTGRRVATGIKLGDTAAIEQAWSEAHHTLTAESDHAEEVEVIFELAKTHGRSLDPAHAQPFEDTASFWRFKVKVPERSRASLLVVERWPETRRIEYQSLDAKTLEAWLRERFLDGPTLEVLSRVRAAWAEAKKLDEQRARAERRREEAYAKQGKISEQLAVLKEGGPEGTLRLRYVSELAEAQDRVNAQEAEIAKLTDAAEKARASATALLAEITRA